jgi:prepilin-type N-terminal cleavage/methylation domain-containing protein
MVKRYRHAVTLIEVLVAIAVVGALVSIAFPAIQAAREAGRRMQCQHNLRQIGLVLATFESATRRLPAGRDAQNRWQHSWATAILPQLEQTDLFERYDFHRAWDDPANQPDSAVNLAVFCCPSATGTWDGKTDYGGNYGSSLTGLTPGFQCGFAWEAGALPPIHIAMPGPHRAAAVALSEFKDGTSQTFLVLEDADRAAKEGGMWANGHNCFAHDNGPVNNSQSKEIFSRHPKGACALLADGSVRFLSVSMESTVVGAFCTRATGEVVAP